MTDTISQLLLNTVKSYPKDGLVLHKKEGQYVPISTAEFGNRVKHFCLGLKDLGFEEGDKMIILSESRPEWIISDLGCLCSGGITVPIYTSLTSESIKYIIDNSDAKIVAYSTPEQWEKIEAIKNELTKVEHYITFSEEAPEGVLTFARVLEKGQKIDCMVLSVDQDRRRIALGLKQRTEDPWAKDIPNKYEAGQIVTGKVTKITNFGVFVGLESGLEGLLHISELADHKVENPEEIEIRFPQMRRGSIKHGDYTPIQMGCFRPNQECSGTNTPIEGLYVCGVSTYPGGLVLGGSGYLGANKVAEDLDVKKWWKPTPEMERCIKTYLE